MNYVKYIESCFISSYAGYYYRRNTVGSLSKQLYSYKFVNDYLHWTVLKQNFEKRNFETDYIKQYLSNELYNMLIDNICEILKYNNYIKSYAIIKRDLSYMNLSYLGCYERLIIAPVWQKK